MTAPLTIRLHPADNVVVARMDILPGTTVEGELAAATLRTNQDSCGMGNVPPWTSAVCSPQDRHQPGSKSRNRFAAAHSTTSIDQG